MSELSAAVRTAFHKFTHSQLKKVRNSLDLYEMTRPAHNQGLCRWLSDDQRLGFPGFRVTS